VRALVIHGVARDYMCTGFLHEGERLMGGYRWTTGVIWALLHEARMDNSSREEQVSGGA
jgi:hypothetical protein